MSKPQTFLIGDVSRISGVSIRALRHYDEIGLLVPPLRSEAGYRLYDECSLLRLQQIMLCRELGFSLEETAQWLDDPEHDQRQSLHELRTRLEQRLKDTHAMIQAVDNTLSCLESGTEGVTGMNSADMFEGFDPCRYEQEAEQRWGETDAYKESARRTRNYTEQDWQKLKSEQAELYAQMQALNQAQVPATEPRAMDIAEQHRLFIDKWFYPCDYTIHLGLADMYEADVRFAENIDKYGEGLTRYLSEAIRANSQRK